jgi:hypothetical protein
LDVADVANAVARIDQLEFLSEIIPRTTTYKKAVARKEQLLMEPDSPEQNGSSLTERKKSRTGKERESAGRGGIERFFSAKGRNGVVAEDVRGDGDVMDIDG